MFDLFTGSRREVEVIGFLTVPFPDRRKISQARRPPCSLPAAPPREQAMGWVNPASLAQLRAAERTLAEIAFDLKVQRRKPLDRRAMSGGQVGLDQAASGVHAP